MGMHSRTKTYWQHAPAKLNLFLELLGRRPDGYHELETVMVAVSLYDTLWVTPNNSGAVSLHLESTHSEKPSRNEASQRRELNRQQASIPPGVSPGGNGGAADRHQEGSIVGKNLTVNPQTTDSHDRLGSHHEHRQPMSVVSGLTGSNTVSSQAGSFGGQEKADFAERHDDEVPTDHRNTVVRALTALRAASGVAAGAHVHLLKRIPSQAGLGGASSDAATALLLANRAWGVNWNTDRLVEIAGGVGSDVPFFLSPGLARCWGRGEKMAAIDANIVMHFVLVKPPIGLSTPEVFRRCSIPELPVSSQFMIAALQAGRIREISSCLLNRLQPAACQLTEWIEQLANEFQTLGCLGHMMSGSGSSYFGVFAHRRQALLACRKLQARQVGSVFAVHSTRGSLPLRP